MNRPIHLTNISKNQEKVIGREAQLQTIRQRLKETSSVVLVNGLGGIGKTTVALEFIHRFGNEYENIAWIEVTDTIASAFVTHTTLTQRLGLTAQLTQLPTDNYEALAFDLILNELNNRESCLLVIDNANQLEDLRQCQHQLRSLRATTLLTSRALPENWATVKINELSPGDAADLFMTHYSKEVQEAQLPLVYQLLQCLDHHTLLIELVAKAAYKANLSLEALYEKVQQNYLHDADLNARRVATGTHADHTKLPQQERVENYITLVFQQISELNEAEQRYLRYMTLLPSNEYAESFLEEVFQVTADNKYEFLDTLEALAQKGWLTQKRDEQGYTYKLHSLIQDVATRELGISYDQCALVVDYWIAALYIDDTKDNPVDKFSLLPYGEFIADKLQAEQHEKIATLFGRIGWIQEDLGQYSLAALKNEKALALDLALFGEKHSNVAVRQSNLANVYGNLGQYELARDLLEKALASAIENFGEKHPKVAVRQSNLALVYRNLGQYERARDLLEKALASDIENFGEKHLKVANRLNNLAFVEIALENWQDAKALLTQAYQIFYDWLGAEHPNTKTVAESLAYVEAQLGEAKASYGSEP